MEKEKRKKNRAYGWGKIFILALVVVLFVRFFLLESCHIVSSSMETAVWIGDFVLVNKTPYFHTPARNSVVLFASPLQKDSAEKKLFLSRCIGMPGDTIELAGSLLKVNGKEVPKSPNTLAQYTVQPAIHDILLSQLKQMDIPVRDLQKSDSLYVISLTPFEEYQLREELPDFINSRFHPVKTADYKLVIPRKGIAYRLDPVTLTACKEIIMAEAGDKADFREGKLFLDGRETTFFFFKHNYYWLLSDNTLEAVDSRHLGLVPEKLITGNAWLIWLSKDPTQDLFHGYRWNRFFNSVH